MNSGQMTCTYNDSEYMYIKSSDDNITYLILVDKGYDKLEGFKMLETMKNYFHAETDLKNLDNIPEFSLNEKFRPTLINCFESWKDKGGSEAKLGLAMKGLDNLKITLNQNIVGLGERDEKLDTLLDKTQEMGDISMDIRHTAVKVKRQIKCKSVMLRFGFSLLALVLIYILIGMFCGFDLSQCTGGNDNSQRTSYQQFVGF